MTEKFEEKIKLYVSDLDLINQSDLSIRNKYLNLKQVLERSCKELTEEESLQFSSLFARLVFLSQRYSLPKSLEWNLQNIRVKSKFLLAAENNLISQKQYEKARNTLDAFFAVLSGLNTDIELSREDIESSKLSLDKLRVQVKTMPDDTSFVICHSLDLLEDIKLKYSQDFESTINRLWVGAQLNLIDVAIDSEGYYIPKLIVLEPDYLIDASAVAECFQPFATSHLQYLRRKFNQVPNSHYILMGNLANFFLDELIYSNDIDNLEFKDVFVKSFAQMPFEYSSCKDISDNRDFKDFMQRANIHFENIRRVIKQDLPQNGFNLSQINLEPSFFSEKYGFQGRLDLLQLAENDSDKDRIIELKSGKAPFPASDPSVVAQNHEVQTQVYRLLIQSVFGKNSRDIFPTILYSSVENSKENLRWSAYYQQLEKDVLKLRNLIVATEHTIYTGGAEAVEKIFREILDVDNYKGSRPQFFLDDLDELETVLKNLSELERLYFYRFVSFISRELYLQKTGDEGLYTAMSQSALWNKSFEERKEALELIADLQIESLEESEHDMLIRFAKKDKDSSHNFREGEICILYPRNKSTDSVLTNQILKGTVIEISNEHLSLRFRYKQKNKSYFSENKYWAVEHDKLDHGYNAMYQSLYSFFQSDKAKRELILGLRNPLSNYQESETLQTLEAKQNQLIDKALSAQDYFLILGPPGTGKTSVFARQIIERLNADTDQNIMVLAYTNRAVDELCAAICSAFCESDELCDSYIRIGSNYSCDEKYRHRLLQNISQSANSRQDLNQHIANTRIFVGTLASILGKPEIFEIKEFNTAIIDEASQILEPQILGLLPKFERFIMIGDQKQLSTISLQNKENSQVKEAKLNEIGLCNCRDSLFERLYYTCQKNGWAHAYDTLSYHGRMHREIAKFVSREFYDNSLIEIQDRQLADLDYTNLDEENKLQNWLAKTRLGFIPVSKKKQDLADKLNKEEAEQVTAIVLNILELYKNNNKIFSSDTSIGIISPYRNQIAMIRESLRETGISDLENIMVDTVERYQGSQKDIIIVSFCMDRAYQLHYFSNMNQNNTVDRKLNVAITRAREQLFLVGDESVLSTNPIYRNLLNSCSRFE